MQALGSYEGGRMLFLGLGTGLGSAMILDGTIAPMEIGHLPFRKATYEDYVGERGRKRLGQSRWRKAVFDTVAQLSTALRRTTSSSAEATSAPEEAAAERGSGTTRTRSSAASASGSIRRSRARRASRRPPARRPRAARP